MMTRNSEAIPHQVNTGNLEEVVEIVIEPVRAMTQPIDPMEIVERANGSPRTFESRKR